MLANNVSVHHVARNTRTSIAMIDKHYAQVNTEQIKDALRQGQEDFASEPIGLANDASEEIKLLEKRIEELKRGNKDAFTVRKIAAHFTVQRR